MSKKVSAGATHTEPTLEITQNLGEGQTAKKPVETMEQLYAKAELELDNVNRAIDAAEDPSSTLAQLKTAITSLNRAIMDKRAKELASMDIVAMYHEYISNPFVTCKAAKANELGRYSLTDVDNYISFEALFGLNRDIVRVGAWQKMVRILRYNMAVMEVRDSGKASTNVTLTADDFSYRKEIGWDVKPSVNTVTVQLTALVAAILPPELCPKTMYKADAKQLMKAIMPEVGTGHETGVTIKREKFFEQKLFAVIRSRMNELSYLYDDESAEAVAKANKGKPPIRQGTLDDATDDQLMEQMKKRGLLPETPAQDESAEA